MAEWLRAWDTLAMMKLYLGHVLHSHSNANANAHSNEVYAFECAFECQTFECAFAFVTTLLYSLDSFRAQMINFYTIRVYACCFCLSIIMGGKTPLWIQTPHPSIF